MDGEGGDRRLWVALGAAVAVLAVGLVAYLVQPEPTSSPTAPAAPLRPQAPRTAQGGASGVAPRKAPEAAGAKLPQIPVTKPIVAPPSDRAAVADALGRAPLAACWTAHHAGAATAAGTAVLKFDADASGAVTRATAQLAAVPSMELKGCFETALRGMTLPRAERDRTVAWPATLRADGTFELAQ
jgi:hypothetical protein